MANPYRSSEGLNARPTDNQDEIQLRIDPMHGDLENRISGLHTQVRRLKGVAQEIEGETTMQNNLIVDLQMVMSQAEAGMKNGMRRLNRTIAQQSKNHILQVILFGLICFTIVYLWSKHFKR